MTGRIIAPGRLATARELSGLSLVEIAKRMDVWDVTVSRIEGQTNMTLETLARYADAIGGRLIVQLDMGDGIVIPLIGPEDAA